MSKRDDRLLVDDILIALQAISEYTCNMDYDGFCESKMTIDAVIRNFEICGEASNYLSAEYKAEHPEIEWQKMTDFRNRLIHHYFGINYEIVWEVIENEVPLYIEFIQNF